MQHPAEQVKQLYAQLPISCEANLSSLLEAVFKERCSELERNINRAMSLSMDKTVDESIPSREDFWQSVQGILRVKSCTPHRPFV